MKVSVIIPCFNAVDKIGRCFTSVREINLDTEDYEVIFIDDCSTDGTYEMVQNACSERKNWRAFRLEKNSGSPSKPRNKGIEVARGGYIYFLDCDDEILPEALPKLLALAVRTDACIVRSELLAETGRERKCMNQMLDWNDALPMFRKLEIIMTRTSTVVNSFIRRSILLENNIRWPEKIRMGEDSLFLAEVLIRSSTIEYLAEPTFVYYKLPSLIPASTQRYGRRELQDHLHVWEKVQQLLYPLGINYLKGRLNVGLRVALESLIFRNRGDVDHICFRKFNAFVTKHWHLISSFKYSQRLKELITAVREDDYQLFLSLCRPRLLIAGHDLKFMRDAIPDLQKHFDIRLDEWTGHETHDEAQSKTLLEWAEYIWCEWLLKNAEWYAMHKRADQRLVVRMHRMELSRDHGSRMNMDNVDAVIAVSPLFLERLLERYPNIPRHKARLIPNYVRTDDYRTDWHPDKLHTLGIIGILPSRKGLHRALEILRILRGKDSRFRLEVFGHRPEDLAWIARNSDEMAYFRLCDQFIKKHGLQDAVHINGHTDIKEALAKRNVGYILSVSDSDYGFPGPESFHLAVADGFSAGSVSLVRPWPGAEYLWPKEFIMNNEETIANRILQYSKNQETFHTSSNEGKLSIKSHYSTGHFIESLVKTFIEVS